MEAFNGFVGADVNEKVENYLLFAGVTMEQIEKIRELLLEETAEENTMEHCENKND